MDNQEKRQAGQPDWHERRIGDIVTALPQAAAAFRSAGVDFCCGGHRLLGEALAAENRSPDELDHALDVLSERAGAADGSETGFDRMDADELTGYIEARHHTYLREALPRIGELAQKTLAAHGMRHPELFRAHALFSHLRADLEQHLIKEEVALFPMLNAGDPASSGDIDRLAAEIRAEHEAAGLVLHELRALTGGYEPPPDHCPTYAAFMDSLSRLEADLFQHIHLENNILLKTAEDAA